MTLIFQFKEASMMRRITRRAKLANIASIEEYAAKVAADKSELNILYEDLLIGVTRFFRDDEPFEFLQNSIIPELLKNRPADKPVRVWVPACATGEEAYSIAILLHEAFTAAGRAPNFKIFATDIHKNSLLLASRGVFREEALQDVSLARRERYFVKCDRLFQISRDIRELIVFASHNLLRDAPFTDLDLVSCRNF